jgi:hypothetical protein
MGNTLNNPDQNSKVNLSKQQEDPYLADPRDFEVSTGEQIPDHGQCCDSVREYHRLLNEGHAKHNAEMPEPRDVNSASSPHSRSNPSPVGM